ncbi:thaumatin family-domain-containing protein [Geopyxis carbonaria]|nr:thaumatin family-domain-containing protein [Geopyxis carbonaria]
MKIPFAKKIWPLFGVVFFCAMVAANNPHAAPWSLTFKNNCPFHLWPGINDNAATSVRAVGPVRGFELPPAAVVTHTMPPNWGGRVWARQGCQFQNGVGRCVVGHCNGQLQCMVGGDPGVTLFEITSNDALSTYWDLSGVDGHSLDMAVQPRARNGTPLPMGLVWCGRPLSRHGCPAPYWDLSGVDGHSLDMAVQPRTGTCLAWKATISTWLCSPVLAMGLPSLRWFPSQYPDFDRWCPKDVQIHIPPGSPEAHHYHLPNAGTGLPMLRPCLSRCTQYNQDIDCCRGAYGTPDTCPMNKYAKRLAHLCPDMYSYAYGDRMATFTDPQNTVYDFEITFCPSESSSKLKWQGPAITQDDFSPCCALVATAAHGTIKISTAAAGPTERLTLVL